MSFSSFSNRPAPHFRGVWVAIFLLWALPQVGHASQSEAGESTYPLDAVSRHVSPRGPVECPKIATLRYAGDILRYHRPVRVHAAFRDRLKEFEAVVRDTAVEIYGRAPKKIVHLGSYNCRRIRGYPNLVSEHGLGNGIDVAGFDFPRLAPGAKAPADLPRRLRRGFNVRLLSHWNGKRGPAKIHARFLRTLAKRLVARPDIFRVLLGPAYPGHKNHFHFDCAPYRMVDIF